MYTYNFHVTDLTKKIEKNQENQSYNYMGGGIKKSKEQ